MKHYKVAKVSSFFNHVVLDVDPISPSDVMTFLPGQYATLAIKRKGYWSPTRCLSVTTAPNNSGRLQFAFRVTGGFTADLAAAQPGDEVRLQGAFGDFQLQPDVANHVLIAGGIGITPFMSMIRTAAQKGSPANITLLYSCSKAEDIPFETELRQLMQRNPRFKAYFFLSNLPAAKQGYSQAPIEQGHLERVTGGEPDAYMYYVCGPESMMSAMRRKIESMGVHRDDILTESFAIGNTERSWFGLTPSQSVYAAGALVMLLLAGAIAVKDVQHTLALTPATQVTAQPVQTQQAQTPASTQVVQPQQSVSNSSPTASSSGSSAVTAPATTPTYTPPAQTYTPPRSQVS